MPLFLLLAQHCSRRYSFDGFTHAVVHPGLHAPLAVTWHRAVIFSQEHPEASAVGVLARL